MADSDIVECQLGAEESKEFQEFDPKINNEESWEPPASMAKFLNTLIIAWKTMNAEPSWQTFPNLSVMYYRLPSWTQRWKNNFPRRAKIHILEQKRLYKLQEQLLEVTGPLTCLWSDLVRPDANPRMSRWFGCYRGPWCKWVAPPRQLTSNGGK